MNRFIALTLAALLVGCATTTKKTMLNKDRSGQAEIYPIGQWDAFDITQRVLEKKYSDFSIIPTETGNTRGFRFNRSFGLDSEDYFFGVTPMVGTQDGKEVSGYIVEGQSSGTYMGTGIGIRVALDAIEAEFKAIHPPVKVTNVHRGDYEHEGGASVYVIDINTFGSHPENVKSVYVAPSKANVKSSDPEFLEYRQIVCKALAERQMSCTPNQSDASVVVFVNYGISSPIVEFNTWSVPIYSTTYRAPVSQTSTVTNSFGRTIGSVQTTEQGFGTFEKQYAGQESGTTKSVTFQRIIEIDAVDTKSLKAKEPVIHWKTRIESTGSSNDLRVAFAYLMKAAAPSLGRSTGKVLRVTVPRK